MSSNQKDQKNKKTGIVKTAIGVTTGVISGLGTVGVIANQTGKSQKQKEMPRNEIKPPKPYGN